MKDGLRDYVFISPAFPSQEEGFNICRATTGLITELTLRRHFTPLINEKEKVEG